MRLPASFLRMTALFCFLATLVFLCPLALPAETVHVETSSLQPAQTLAARVQTFTRLMSGQGASAQDLNRFTVEFQKLPAALQDAILRSLQPTAKIPSMIPKRVGPVVTKVPNLLLQITSVYPDIGQAGEWSIASGVGFGTNCAASLDGATIPSQFVNWPPKYPNTIWFEVPSATSRGVNHDLAIADAVANAHLAYEIIAPRGYRGLYGWSFQNWASGKAPWYLYRDYFGSAFAGSTEAGSSQAAINGYENFYAYAGHGGNCFGMSVSSLRFKVGALGTYWHSYFTTAPNVFPIIWDYAQVQQTSETVMEDQGSQMAQEFLDAHLANFNVQSPQDVWNRVNTLLADPSNPPVLLLWGHGWGHTIIPWRTDVVGNDHRIVCWDNNNPYSETESGNPEAEVCHIDWVTGAISYEDGYNFPLTPKHFVCMSYHECTPATPHITSVGYSNAPWSCVGVAGPGTQVAQITDEGGHTFFLPNGDTNDNPATRIPNSAPVYPMIAVPPLSGASGQPTLFTFTHTQGKSLTFQFAGAGPRQLSLYFAGTIFTLQATGAGQVRLLDIFRPTCRLEVSNPATLRPTSLDVIHTVGGVEHTFQLRNLSNLGTQAFSAHPVIDGSSLQIQAAPGAKFDLNLLGRVGQGQASFAGITVQPNLLAAVGADNWGNLAATTLLLQHTTAAGAIQQTLHLPRAH